MFGFINIYKPTGKTSHDIVAILRKITKIKQIGHTGTLDPFAEGVLPICIGKATRLIEYLADDKAYIATIQLGKSTTTYDREGEWVNVSEKKVVLQEIEGVLPNFRGEIQQIPPVYSAIKVKGKKLYEYARKGEDVEINPRTVNIHSLEIVDFDESQQILQLVVECSKGTYIRSIANDLGELLGCYGYLTKLVRIKAGNFNIDNAIPIEDLKVIDDVEKSLIYPLEYLQYPQIELTLAEFEKVSHGMSICSNAPDGITILTKDKRIVAIAKAEEGKLAMSKVFI